jgi:hypothetical protein
VGNQEGKSSDAAATKLDMGEARLREPASDVALFSERARTDPSPARNAESSFAFLDRVDQPYWARIRETLDQWFAAYPSGECARDLRSRFRKRDERQHYAAWWELYLFTVFTKLGFEVSVHPRLDGTRDRPDFRISSESGSFLVEAATTFSGIDDGRKHSPVEAEILDALEHVRSASFTLSVDFDVIGTSTPSVREIVEAVEAWLDDLDPDASADVDTLERSELAIRDWVLDLTAFPIEPEHRGKPGRVVSYGPMMAGSVNDTEKLRATLKRKSGKYGVVQEPLVLAVLMPSTFADLKAVEKALFGDVALQYTMGQRGNERWVRLRNGAWLDKSGPRAQHVAGVITGFGLLPGETVASRWPRLWPNPWTELPLTLALPFPRSVGSTEAQFVHDAEPAEGPRGSLGLPDDWPGPDAPFIGLD